MFPATLSDSVGEVPIVICIIQEICKNRQHVHSSTPHVRFMTQGKVYSDSHLNDDPLHHTQEVQY